MGRFSLWTRAHECVQYVNVQWRPPSLPPSLPLLPLDTCTRVCAIRQRAMETTLSPSLPLSPLHTCTRVHIMCAVVVHQSAVETTHRLSLPPSVCPASAHVHTMCAMRHSAVETTPSPPPPYSFPLCTRAHYM